MQIHCLSTFLDGRDRYQAGDTRTVADADGARFIAAGWAADVTAASPPPAAAIDTGAVELTIHNSTIATGDNHG